MSLQIVVVNGSSSSSSKRSRGGNNRSGHNYWKWLPAPRHSMKSPATNPQPAGTNMRITYLSKHMIATTNITKQAVLTHVNT